MSSPRLVEKADSTGDGLADSTVDEPVTHIEPSVPTVVSNVPETSTGDRLGEFRAKRYPIPSCEYKGVFQWSRLLEQHIAEYHSQGKDQDLTASKVASDAGDLENAALKFGGRQGFYPDASRIFMDIDRTISGRSEEGEGSILDRKADFDFVRVLPPGGYTKKGEVAGVDYFPYKPYALAGTLLVVTSLFFLARHRSASSTSITGLNPRRGLLAGVSISFSWGLGMVLAKIPLSETSSIVSAFYSMLFAVLTQGVYVRARMPSWNRRGRPALHAATRKAAVFLLISGMLGAFAFLFFVIALSFGPVAIVAPLSTLSPVLSLVFSYIFIRKAESINNATILSTIGVVIGAYWVATG